MGREKLLETRKHQAVYSCLIHPRNSSELTIHKILPKSHFMLVVRNRYKFSSKSKKDKHKPWLLFFPFQKVQFYYMHDHVYICAHEFWCPQSPKEVLGWPDTGVTGGFEQPAVGALQEQFTFFMAEPSLQIYFLLLLLKLKIFGDDNFVFPCKTRNSNYLILPHPTG